MGDSGDANSPPNFWQGPINTGPLSDDKSVDDPVTSGSDNVDQDASGIVDKPADAAGHERRRQRRQETGPMIGG